jgi:hypothetical protein
VPDLSVTKSIIGTGIMNLPQCRSINYISDIHLLHRIKKSGVKTKEIVIENAAKSVAEVESIITLINGDVSSDFFIFKYFVESLRRNISSMVTVCFTLGNHELWSFEGYSLDSIVDI